MTAAIVQWSQGKASVSFEPHEAAFAPGVVPVAFQFPATGIIAGIKGDRGEDGADGSELMTMTAQGALSGHRIVRFASPTEVAYASADTVSHANSVLGITTGAAAGGDIISIRSTGAMTEPGWSWVPDLPVFLGINGVMTQTPPEQPGAVFSVKVATAITPTWVLVRIEPPVFII